ncbi:MAG TPA: MBL fold metallo-hydrolase, partial [Anaerolineae bacterium]
EDLLYGIVFRGARPPMRIDFVDVKPGIILSAEDFEVVAFPVQHRGPDCYGYLFQEQSRRPFLNDKATELGVPNGPERKTLVNGQPITLADGRVIEPEQVLGELQRGSKLAITGDIGETDSIIKVVREADMLVTEATYSDTEAEMALQNAHLTAGRAARLASEAAVSQLVLTHISGRHREKDLEAEARAIFPNTVIARDFDTFKVARTTQE